MALSRRAVRRRARLVRLLEDPPCSPRLLRRDLAQVLSNYPDRHARARVWDEMAYWAGECEAAAGAPGMFDDLGNGMYGPLDIDRYREQAHEELEAALDAAAAYVRPAVTTCGRCRNTITIKETACPS